jgi:hypothetical protein
MITVLALAVEPFTQQIIHPVLCHRLQSGVLAEVPRANNCTGLGAYTGPAVAALDAGMTAAMYTGLLNNSQAVEAQCSTGNCTFTASPDTVESYQTFGFTSICVDIEKEFRGMDQVGTSWSIPSLGNNSEVSSWLGNSTRTLSTGSMYQRGDYPPATFGHYWPIEQNATALLQFAALTVAVDWTCYRDHVNTLDTERCMKPVGAECKLWPAVQSIKGSVELGELQETVTSKTFLQYDQLAGSWLHVSSRVLRNGTWQDCTPSRTESLEQPVPINNNTIWRPKSDEKYPEGLQWYTQDCVWTIDYQTDIALREQLNLLFTDRGVQLKGALGRADMSWGDVWIKQIYRNGTASASTIGEQIGQLASSMTAYNRMKPRPETTLGFAYGDANKVETCVQVRWPWIAFPATLVLLSSIFLALTIRSTKQGSSSVSGRKVWKTSSLAVLFNGLDEHLLKNQGPMVRKSEMVDRAAKLKVVLEFEDDGWKLRAYTNN